MTAQIIDFQKHLDRRNAERAENAIKSLDHETLIKLIGLAVVASTASEQSAKQVKKEKPAPTVTPAYCDPSNEVRGNKYDETQNMDIADVAKLVRADIKAGVKSGELPKGLKCSVRIERYSMGQSMSVTVTAVPEDFKIHTKEYARLTDNGTYYGRLVSTDEEYSRYTPETEELLQKLEKIVGAYNRDNSDSMSDYFERRFYAHIGIGGKVEKADFEK